MKVTFNVNKHKHEGVIREGFLYHNSTGLYQKHGTRINGTPGYKYRLKLRNPNKNGIYTIIISFYETIYVRPVKTLTKVELLEKEQKSQARKEFQKLKKTFPKRMFGFDIVYTKKQILFGCGEVKINYKSLPEIIKYFSTVPNVSYESRKVINETLRRFSINVVKRYLPELTKISNAISKSAKNNNS